MKKLLRSPFLFAFFCLFLACKTSINDPCDGLMNESPPQKIGVLLLDKRTGNNLLQTDLINLDDIKVTLGQTGAVFKNWRVINSSNLAMNGIIELAVFHEKAGEYSYKIELKNLSTVDLSYIIKQEKTNDPCKTYSYPMSNFKVLNHDFEQFKYEGKTAPNILVVQLDLD